jgi:hypothetical protein
VSEIEMNQRVSIARFGLEYDAFLFSSLGDDRHGMPLAIASVLGRMDLDPWHEAAALAALPADAAAKKLASFIEAMPDQPPKPPDSATLAARLITLLPAQSKTAARVQDPPAGTGAEMRRGPVIYLLWLALFCIVLLGASFVNVSR